MTILSEENLKRCIEAAKTRQNWAAIMASTVPPARESTAYNWIARSRRDAAAHMEGVSPFYIEIDGEHAYYHQWMLRSKIAFSLMAEGRVLDHIAGNSEEVCLDPATQLPILARDPRYMHLSDAQMLKLDLDPSTDRYLWNEDELGLRTTVKFQMKAVKPSSQLVMRALATMIPSWADRSELDVKHSGNVVHQIEARFVSRDSQPQAEIVDGSFVEVAPRLAAPERQDIAALRAQYVASQADPNRVTRPQGPVRDACGHVIGTPRNDELKPTREDGKPPMREARPLDQHPRAYAAPQPTQPAPQQPSYARRSANDPHNSNNRAAPAGSNRSITK